MIFLHKKIKISTTFRNMFKRKLTKAKWIPNINAKEFIPTELQSWTNPQSGQKVIFLSTIKNLPKEVNV